MAINNNDIVFAQSTTEVRYLYAVTCCYHKVSIRWQMDSTKETWDKTNWDLQERQKMAGASSRVDTTLSFVSECD